MNYLLALPGFLLLHMCFGRMISIPCGLTIFSKWYIVIIIAIIYDFFQILFYNGFFELILKLKPVNYFWRILRHRLKRYYRKFGLKRALKKERMFHSSVLHRAQKWGQMGVIVIAAIPFVGGGIWSASLLAISLRLGKIRRYILLISGSIISYVLIIVGFHGVQSVIARLLAVLK